MPTTVIFPKVSLEASSGRVARWLVAEGQAVTPGQILFEIDNDKAAVEVEAQAAGIIEALAPEGEEVEVGAAVALIREAGSARPPAQEAAVAVPMRAAASSSNAPAFAPAAQPRSPRRGPNPTPLARRIARDNGLSLQGLAGTGPRGRVRSVDVQALLAAPARPAPTALSPGSAPGLHAQWLRRGEGTPVVLLHGFSADLNGWRGFVAGATARWPILALDLPGHGRSPRETPSDLDAVAACVEATLAAEGVGPVVLAGHSLGGAVAARVASRGRADVRGLCLFAPAGLGPQIDGAFVEGILRARSPDSLRPWLQWLVHDPAVITKALVDVVAAQREDVGLTEAMQRMAWRFFADGTQCVSIRDDLARVRVPIRVVFGRQDRVLPFAATRTLPGTVALHALEDCGHMPHLEQPELCARILDEVRRSG